MTRKASFSNFPALGNTLKRTWWLGLIALIALFEVMPLSVCLTVLDLNCEPSGYAETLFSVTENGALTLMLQLYIVAALAAVFGVTLFHYMQTPKQSAFYHSLPIKRSTLLTHRLIAGSLYFAVPLLFNLGLSLLLAGLFRILPYVSAADVLTRLAMVLLMFFMVFGVTVLAGTLAGTTLAQIEITLLILFAPILTWVLCRTLPGCFMASWSSLEEGVFLGGRSMFLLCPPLDLLLAPVYEEILPAGYVITYLLYGGVSFFLAYVLYRARSMERVGDALMFRPTVVAVRVIVCGVFGLALGSFLSIIASGMVSRVIGYLLGGFIGHLIVQVQVHKDIRSIFKNLPTLAAVEAVLIVGAFALTVLGPVYDTAHPGQGEIISATVTVSDTSSEEFDTTAMSEILLTDTETLNALTDLIETIAQGTPVASSGILDDENYIDCSANGAEYAEYYNQCRITVDCRLANGGTFRRNYTLRYVPEALCDKIEAFFSRDEFDPALKVNTFMSYDLTSLEVDNCYADNYILVTDDPELIRAVLEAAQADYAEHGCRLFDSGNGDIGVYYTPSVPAFFFGLEETFDFIHISDDFEHTRALLDERFNDFGQTFYDAEIVG